jgi:hypothetical protein
MCGTIVVGIAEHDNQMPPKISARVALIEIETSHTDRIIEAQSGTCTNRNWLLLPCELTKPA